MRNGCTGIGSSRRAARIGCFFGALAASLCALPAAQAEDTPFLLHNRTGVDAVALYASPRQVGDWKGNLLENGTVYDGDDADIDFDRDEAPSSWDLKLVDRTGQSMVWPSIDLRGNPDVVLRLKDGQPQVDLSGDTD